MKNDTNKWAENGLREAVGYRPFIKPEIPKACKNCKHCWIEGGEREGSKGAYFQVTATHCALNIFKVNRTSVCDKHEFKHADRRDA